MSTDPIYTVTPLAHVQNAVHIETEVPPSPFYDESHTFILQVVAPDAVPLMQAYLSGLSLGTSWTGRECTKSASLKSDYLPDGHTGLSLSYCANSNRMPADWFSLLAGDEDYLLELCVTDESLARQMFNALRDGTIQLRSADLFPV